MKDGYAIGDIESRLNVDELQKYLSTDVTDMAVLWTMLVDKTEGREVTEQDVINAILDNQPLGPRPIVNNPPEPKKEQTVEESNAKPEKIRVVKAAPVVIAPKKKGRPAGSKNK